MVQRWGYRVYLSLDLYLVYVFMVDSMPEVWCGFVWPLIEEILVRCGRLQHGVVCFVCLFVNLKICGLVGW